jgi:hypothetical protein
VSKSENIDARSKFVELLENENRIFSMYIFSPLPSAKIYLRHGRIHVYDHKAETVNIPLSITLHHDCLRLH